MDKKHTEYFDIKKMLESHLEWLNYSEKKGTRLELDGNKMKENGTLLKFYESFLNKDFSHSCFKKAVLINCKIMHSNFSFSNFEECNLQNSYFLRCNFTRVNFDHSNLENVSMARSNVSWTSLQGCDLKNAIFKSCLLERADFRNSNLDGIKFIKSRIDRSYFDCDILPFDRGEVKK